MPTTLPRRGARSTPVEHGSGDGIEDYHRPTVGIPELPEDITDLDDVELMRLMTACTAWVDFASVKLSVSQVTERRCEMELKSIRANELILSWGDNTGRDGKVTIAEARRDSSPRVTEINQLALDAYAQRKRLEVRVEALVRDAAAISRELTRRLGSEGPRRREARWGTG